LLSWSGKRVVSWVGAGGDRPGRLDKNTAWFSSVVVMGKIYQLRLAAIEKALRGVQRNFKIINSTLCMHREPMNDVHIENMMTGYRYVNDLLSKDVRLFTEEYMHHALELNHIVLCGTDPTVRLEYTYHIQQTAERFYAQAQCNIDTIVKWHKRHRDDSAWKRAASTYIYMLSRPQLFFEGNHRTGALLMSAILARDGKPPFVLTVENAQSYFDPSTMIKSTHKNMFTNLYKLPKIEKKMANFLKVQADPAYIYAK